jgi:hypothetical protein
MAASQAHMRRAARLAAVSMVAGIPMGEAANPTAAAFMGVEAAPMAEAEVTDEREAGTHCTRAPASLPGAHVVRVQNSLLTTGAYRS